MICLFLDDVRETPEGWHRVFTAKEAISFLSENWEKVEKISLDHDLGEDEEIVGNGYIVVLWIEEFIANNKPPTIPRQITVHSSNSSARLKMEAGIQSCYRLFNEKES